MEEQHLIDQWLLGLRQAVVVQWNTKTIPTDKNDPWRLSFRQTGLDLEPVTVVFSVVISRKPCEAGLSFHDTKPGQRIAGAAGMTLSTMTNCL